jgi:molybdenum cofactor guanylyltransferase
LQHAVSRSIWWRLAPRRAVETTPCLLLRLRAARAHPVFALSPVSLHEDLRRALSEEGARKVDAWVRHYPLTMVSFPIAPFAPFFNINKPAALAKAEPLLAMARPFDNDDPGV